jgi:hypothetical protein
MPLPSPHTCCMPVYIAFYEGVPELHKIGWCICCEVPFDVNSTVPALIQNWTVDHLIAMQRYGHRADDICLWSFGDGLLAIEPMIYCLCYFGDGLLATCFLNLCIVLLLCCAEGLEREVHRYLELLWERPPVYFLFSVDQMVMLVLSRPHGFHLCPLAGCWEGAAVAEKRVLAAGLRWGTPSPLLPCPSCQVKCLSVNQLSCCEDHTHNQTI